MPHKRGVRAKDYGAKGDGLVNDAPALQAAIDEAHRRGGGEVYLPAGRYKMDGWHAANPDCGCSVELKDGVKLFGDGPETVIEYGLVAHATIAASQKTDIGVRDLAFAQKYGDVMHGALKIYACNEAHFKNLRLDRGYYLASLNSCHHSSIADSEAYDCLVAVKLMEAYIPYQQSDDCWAIDIKTDRARVGFATQGWGPPYMARGKTTNSWDDGSIWTRSRNCHFVRCTVGDTIGNAFRVEYAEDIYLEDCSFTGVASDPWWDARPFFLCNVKGCTLTRCSHPPFMPPAGSTDWISHGSEDCTDIIVS